MSKYLPLMENLRYRFVKNRRIPATEAALRDFENAIGAALPSDYKVFLAEFGFASSHGRIEISRSKSEQVSVEVFYGLGSGDSYDIMLNKEMYSGELPSHLLPIARGAGGEYCIGLAGEESGRVFWWLPTAGFKDIKSDLTYISFDFDSFLKALVCED